jgi:uncharacterized protein YggU (UPF0235/DUF167 family)
MLIHVKVEAGSRKEEVIEKNDTSFIVKVKAEAKENAANKRMLELLSSHLKIPQNKLQIITGHHVPGKIVEIKDK